MLKNTMIEMNKNGINEGLNTLKYKVKEIMKSDLYTQIIVDYDKYSIMNKWFTNFNTSFSNSTV